MGILDALRGGSRSDAIRQSTTLTTTYLLEQNRKFEAFMGDKIAELESRVAGQQARVSARADAGHEDGFDFEGSGTEAPPVMEEGDAISTLFDESFGDIPLADSRWGAVADEPEEPPLVDLPPIQPPASEGRPPARVRTGQAAPSAAAGPHTDEEVEEHESRRGSDGPQAEPATAQPAPTDWVAVLVGAAQPAPDAGAKPATDEGEEKGNQQIVESDAPARLSMGESGEDGNKLSVEPEAVAEAGTGEGTENSGDLPLEPAGPTGPGADEDGHVADNLPAMLNTVTDVDTGEGGEDSGDLPLEPVATAAGPDIDLEVEEGDEEDDDAGGLDLEMPAWMRGRAVAAQEAEPQARAQSPVRAAAPQKTPAPPSKSPAAARADGDEAHEEDAESGDWGGDLPDGRLGDFA